jgi:hypothetical protein
LKRFLAALLAIGALLGPVAPSSASEEYVCWYIKVLDPWTNALIDAMRCRIDGVLHDDGFPPDGPEDVTLVYDVGYDTFGECYYRRTGTWTGWIGFGVQGQRMNFWWDPDAVPGGPLVGDAWFDPCTSEPTIGEPPITLVYTVIRDHDFVDPAPSVVPDGIGLTGARSYLNVTPPAPVVSALVSPLTGARVEVEIKVATVSIRWGDGAEVSIPESQFDLFGPHPDGDVAHRWEVKGHHGLEVDYNWFVRWRVDSGPWNVIGVPATQWSAPYRVDEIVGRRSG